MTMFLGLLTAVVLLFTSSYVVTDVKPNPENTKVEVVVSGETLVSYRYGDDIQKLADALNNGDTVHLECLSCSEGGLTSIIVKDEALIKNLYEALAQVHLGKQSDNVYTDSDDGIIFTLDDETKFSFNFNHRRYEVGTAEIYELQNDGALWAVWNDILEYNYELEQFSFSSGSHFVGINDYSVYEKDGEYYLDVRGSKDGVELNVSGEPLSYDELWELMDIVDSYRLMRWDGFDESDLDVMDGDEFSMNIVFKGGESMHAHGYMRYPENYDAVKNELIGLLTKIYME